MRIKSPKAFDMFCGCGGISAGLRSAGFNVIGGADINKSYICTFERNFADAVAITDDLSKLTPTELMDRLHLSPGELDLLAGGPPCQGFSKNVPRKSRFLDLPNNQLVRTFLSYVEALKPKSLLIENVAEMKNGFDRAYTDEIVARLSDQGYAVSYQVLNAADYGVPQRRRRAFFLASLGNRPLRFPSQTHVGKKQIKPKTQMSLLDSSLREHVTVWEAIGDLPSVGHDDSRTEFSYALPATCDFQKRVRDVSSSIRNHKPRKLAATQLERLGSILPGQGLKDLPDHLRPKSGYSGAYGRLTKDMVAPTITRWVFHPGSGRFGHPEDIRVLTIREAARIQGFPDDFEFVGTYTQQAGQVGNAVPPLLVERIATAIGEQLNLL